MMLGVERGAWRTLRPANGASGPHRLRRALAPEPSSASLLHSATRPSTSTPSSVSSVRPRVHSTQLDPTRHTTSRHDPTRRRPNNDLEPPCAHAFIDRGRSVYVNFRIKSRLEAGPRHPMFSHWSGKKGASTLFDLFLSPKRDPFASRLEAGPHRPTLAHWTEEKGA